MACAANFAFGNRQVIMNEVRGAFELVFRRAWPRLGMELLYDVAHNIAKLEEHEVDGETTTGLGAPQGGDARLRPRQRPRSPSLPRRSASR